MCRRSGRDIFLGVLHDGPIRTAVHEPFDQRAKRIIYDFYDYLLRCLYCLMFVFNSSLLCRIVDRYGPCKSLKLGDFVDREVGAIVL